MATASGLYPAANEWFQSNIPDYYPGNTVAGFNPYQNQGFDSLAGASGKVASSGQGMMDIFNSRLQSGQGMNPYLQQVADNYSGLMNKNFAERTLPAMRGKQIASGNVGGSAAGIAQGLATQDLNREISDTTSQMYMNDWQQAMEQMPQMQQMYQNSQMLPGQTQLQIGSMQQAQSQTQIDGERDRWNYYRDAPENRLLTYSNMLNGVGNYTNQTGTQTQGTPSMDWGSVAGGGLMYMSPYLNQMGQQSTTPTSQWGSGGLLGG